ncbi:NADH-dependent [FeFe] hydrogenase, group A6 [Clostridium tertium]|jgi:NADH-quinone oxidoreductase subunit G|uniref:NADH-dependent [FeFe] hydrogenase, group A6 n=1 Tax=Clostridium TaxID=1485 RepID=UPI001D299F33|nr:MULTISPECIES: NADH-dependent [FeFe] hydrogenase, group A6 [Clostridium]MBS5307993.1 [FeFe] hydrogenase, group A [Clostridium sp.]MDB1921376.1 NADH-dependent [FeFe] hydrogenase, group A6 [Clostridium tertium]MDB1924621.1 NADH-dependent [FeFe] hydrogenase, group A6 [Clostridium tertium]MDB1928150.1 NADH-dependent [FeFe] hydrogenase, group A6 [Clostridium tertium]MDB1945287.1 NADH-dependent [FeFe] hydrogenase, group A6 [Clostridium tertium]
MISVKINGVNIEVEKGTSILDATKKLNINLPTLCHMYMVDGKTRNCKGTCRVCVVEVEGWDGLVPACATEVREGMSIKTNSLKAIRARRTIVELLLSNHPKDCLNCDKNMDCELQKLAADLGIDENKYEGEKVKFDLDVSDGFIRDREKCILCRRCVTACNDIQKIHAITVANRGFGTNISTFSNDSINETNCTYCGQCVAVCPTGALREKSDYKKVWGVLDDNNKYVVAQIAPAVRSALAEEFGLEPGELSTGKIVTALKLLSFDSVFDTNFAADLTIMEEANEFIERFTLGENLPLITSCCPAWVNYAESNYYDNLNLVSSCKSPQQIFGAIAKNYLPQELAIKRENLVVVSIMPCIAKKHEANRKEMEDIDGIKDVDLVITTRELAKIIKEAGIDIVNLPDSEFDNPLGVSSGAGTIFGTSGGVMEAALRTAYEWITGKELEKLDFENVRGLEEIKEAKVDLNGKEINVAVVSSLGNAKKIMNEIKAGNSKYHFIEVMACPGGCIDGGGQPFIKSNRDVLKKRMNAIYNEDKNKIIRKSHENPMIQKLYKDYLQKPNSYIAHHILHINYKRS